MKVVTSGKGFMDIDAYGGCIAYAELLRVQGEEAVAVSTAPLNESIPPSVRAWNAPFETAYSPGPADTFVLVDISDPGWFEEIVRPDKIVEIIDHHLDFRGYWQARPAVKADIEFIGAACTKVYERWKAAGLLEGLSVTSARLLVCGILDNTLNFKAKITTERDRTAYDDLMSRDDLPADWTAQYFSECQEGIEVDLPRAVQNDLKDFRHMPELPDYVGQLVIWDAGKILKTRTAEIAAVLGAQSQDWTINIVSIHEGCSYFMAHDPIVQAKLSPLLGLHFKHGIAKANRLWLRKEIIHLIEELRERGRIPFSPTSEVY